MNAILIRPSRVLHITAGLLVSSTALLLCCSTALLSSPTPAHADIFQWEYINPADPNQGKRQSTTLAPDGAGVDAVPGTDLAFRNLTMAYLIGADMTSAYFNNTNLTSAELTDGNFTNASFHGATLTDAKFAGAEVRAAQFGKQYGYNCSPYFCGEFRFGTGITPAQLYPTTSYQAGDLSGIGFAYNDLVGGNFAGQDLTTAFFYGATLTDAEFTGAEVRGASFAIDGRFGGTGISPAQLESTVSFQNHDLRALDLQLNDFVGANFAGQNLTNANFTAAALTAADFNAAEIRGANFSREWTNLGPIGTGITLAQLYATATYANGDLSGLGFSRNDLTGGNFIGQDLTNSDFTAADLSGTDFTGAEIGGTKFDKVCRPYVCDGSGISPTQLYSTASYQAQDLSGIGFRHNKLAGINLASQNLTNSSFGYLDSGYDDFLRTTLVGADLTGADARGAGDLCVDPRACTGATTTNLIRWNGHIFGLDLDSARLLIVRDYDGNPITLPEPTGPIPITIDQHLTMGPGGTLRMVFESDAWDSTIFFAPGIPVALGGTLELTFADDVNLPSQVGRTLKIFDWSGVTPTGAFTILSPYRWDFSNLYTTGEVTLSAVPEPSTLLLLSFALNALIAMGRVHPHFFESGKGEIQ